MRVGFRLTRDEIRRGLVDELPVRDPSLPAPVGVIRRVELDEHELRVVLDLDEEALRARLDEMRPVF